MFIVTKSSYIFPVESKFQSLFSPPLHSTTTSDCPGNSDMLVSKPHLPDCPSNLTMAWKSPISINLGALWPVILCPDHSLYSLLQNTSPLNNPAPSTPSISVSAIHRELLHMPLPSHTAIHPPWKSYRLCGSGCVLFALCVYLFLGFFQTFVASTLWNSCRLASPVILPN